MSGELHTSGSYERKEYFEGILKNLYQSRRLTADVQLLPVNALDENDTLLAHKNILAAVSRYFWDLFDTEVKTGPEVDENVTMSSIAQCPPGQSTSKFKIPIDKAVLEIVLECIYLDQYVITLDNWKGLLDASKILKLDKLTQICHEFIKDQKVTKETWLIHFQLAKNDVNGKKILEEVYEFLKTISTEICDMEEFLGLEFHELKMLVNAGVFGNSTDLQKAKFCWFGFENHLKTTHLNDLFKLELPNHPRIDSLQSLDESSSGNTGSSPDLNDPNFIPQDVGEVPEGQDEVKQGQQSTDTQVASSLKRKAGSTKKNPLQTKSLTSKDAPKTVEDAGEPPQSPLDVQAHASKRRGRPPTKKELQEQPQPSKAPIIENKEVEPPSPKTVHKLIESTKGLTVSLGPRVEVKLKTTEPESMQFDEVIDSTTKTENMGTLSDSSDSTSSDHVRKKRAREDEEETSRKNSKVEEKKISTSSSNEVKDKLDQPGSSSSVDSGSKSSSSDANGRGNESIKEIKDKPAGIPRKRGRPSKEVKKNENKQSGDKKKPEGSKRKSEGKEQEVETTKTGRRIDSEGLTRENFQKSLQEILKNKIASLSEVEKEKISSENTPQVLAEGIVEELGKYFKGGVSSIKSKTKYRSIHFNLRDEKNTLWRDLISGSIKPRALVRMEPHEMASPKMKEERQSLQLKELEKIKKLEMESLAETKKIEFLAPGAEFKELIIAEPQRDISTILISPPQKPSIAPRKWPSKCEHCPLIFQNDEEMAEHLENGLAVDCGICLKTFGSPGCLKHHRSVVHANVGVKMPQRKSTRPKGNVESPKITLKYYGCRKENCQRVYTAEDARDAHEAAHDNPFE